MFSRLLVAFDGSPHARRALAEEIELAQAGHGRLTVIAVIPAASPWLGAAAALPMERGGFDVSPEAEFQAMLDRALRTVPATFPWSGSSSAARRPPRSSRRRARASTTRS
jgi:nucleotide-binding universal stress UspA family protein